MAESRKDQKTNIPKGKKTEKTEYEANENAK